MSAAEPVSVTTKTMPDRLRRAGSPALRTLFRVQALFGGVKLDVDETSAPLPPDGRPIIFAANHTNSQDIPRIACVLNRPFYIVAATDGMFGAVNKLVCNAHGTIWLERDESDAAKASRRRAHDEAVTKLRAGNDVLIFPEAVWNPVLTWTDGLPMLPFFKGVVTIARDAGAHIVPIVTEYTPDKVCHVRVCDPFADDPVTDPVAATDALRAAMAATKQDLRFRHGPMGVNAYMEMRARWRKAYPQWDPEREVKFVQGYTRDPGAIRARFFADT